MLNEQEAASEPGSRFLRNTPICHQKCASRLQSTTRTVSPFLSQRTASRLGRPPTLHSSDRSQKATANTPQSISRAKSASRFCTLQKKTATATKAPQNVGRLFRRPRPFSSQSYRCLVVRTTRVRRTLRLGNSGEKTPRSSGRRSGSASGIVRRVLGTDIDSSSKRSGKNDLHRRRSFAVNARAHGSREGSRGLSSVNVYGHSTGLTGY